MRRRVAFVLIMVAMLLILQSCFGSEDDKGSDHVGETASLDVEAAEGGKLTSPSGAAEIEIPAGALAEDTTITLESLGTKGQPESEKLGSDVYEFGPDGLEFLQPVTITLELDIDVPEKNKAFLAVLDGDTWTAVEGSAFDGDKVSGSVSHFSKYAVYFVGDDTIIESGDEICKNLEFSPCGGDVLGSWKPITYCTSKIIEGENPFKDLPACADDLFEMNVEWLGSVTYKADGSMSNGMGMKMWLYLELTDECLAELAGGDSSDLEAVCSSISDNNKIESCSYESGLCKCESTPTTRMMDDSPDATYELDGNNIVITSSEGEQRVIPYCVENGRMVAQTPADDNGDVSYVVSERL